MPLRFDPASILAPGGIASGLDDLGAAVMNAMNRRAERKYALEADARNRQRQLEDQASSRTFQTGEREAGQRFSKELADTRRGREWEDNLRKDEEELERRVLAPIPATEEVRTVDPDTGKVIVEQRPVDREAILRARRAEIGGFMSRYYTPDRELGTLKRFEAAFGPATPEAPGTAPVDTQPEIPETVLVPTERTIAEVAQRPVGEGRKFSQALDPGQGASFLSALNPLKSIPAWFTGDYGDTASATPVATAVPGGYSRRDATNTARTQTLDQAAAQALAADSLQGGPGVGRVGQPPTSVLNSIATASPPAPAPTPAAKAAEALAPAPAPVTEAPAPAPVTEAPAPAPVTEAPAPVVDPETLVPAAIERAKKSRHLPEATHKRALKARGFSDEQIARILVESGIRSR